jgi:REP element-mobilizing transposase RayT
MPRSARKAPGDMVFHVINRGVGRRELFLKEQDYAAFEGILEEVMRLVPTRLLAYVVMPNHWHLVLWPRADGELAWFMQRLTITHAGGRIDEVLDGFQVVFFPRPVLRRKADEAGIDVFEKQFDAVHGAPAARVPSLQ